MGGYWDYLGDVERFFAVARASGFLLSASDCEKVRGWYLRGVPLRVVLDGILRGLESFRFHAASGQKAPHHLSYYSRFIAARVRSFRHEPASFAHAHYVHAADFPQAASRPGTVPSNSSQTREALLHLLAEADLLLHAEEREPERAARQELRDGLAALVEQEAREGLSEQSLEHALLVLDEAVLDFYHSRLDAAAIAELERQTAQELAGRAGLGVKALEGLRKQALARGLRERLGIPELTR